MSMTNLTQRFLLKKKEDFQKDVDEAMGLVDLWKRLGLTSLSHPTKFYRDHLESLGFDLNKVKDRGRIRFLMPDYKSSEQRKKSKVLNVGRKEACRLNGIKSGEAKTKRLLAFVLENFDKIFCENSIWDGPRVRRIITRYNSLFNWLDKKCQKCGNQGEWQGEPITLQIDHIDGRSHNNSLENLRYLCPNCHSQTPTFMSKNKNKFS